jgi:predicted metal-dependent HD superfamily phosphohydrolase
MIDQMTEPGDQARPATAEPAGLAGPPGPVNDPHRAGATLLARWHRRFPGAPRVGAELLERYREDGRRYHDVRHLADVAARLDWLCAPDLPAVTVELAAWFHDAVYRFDGSDNEGRSADLAREVLVAHGFDPPVVEETARLVRLTRDHVVAGNDRDGALLCDADLGILAVDGAAYDDYAARVRAEYAVIDTDRFVAGRCAVLERLLARPTLFGSGRAAGWEEPARANLRRELSRLGAAVHRAD